MEQYPDAQNGHGFGLAPEDAKRYHEFVLARVLEDLVHTGSVGRQLLAHTLSRVANAAGHLQACQGSELCECAFFAACLVSSADDWIGHPEHPAAGAVSASMVRR